MKGERSAMSQGSHATGHGGGGGSRNAAPPVPYGDALLDHSPPVFCSCNLKCLKLISWSEGNPVRRYYRCQNVHVRFFVFVFVFFSESVLSCILVLELMEIDLFVN